MNCANAIRLQINFIPNNGSSNEVTSSYLKSFFENHPTWKAFQPKLMVINPLLSLVFINFYVLFGWF